MPCLQAYLSLLLLTLHAQQDVVDVVSAVLVPKVSVKAALTTEAAGESKNVQSVSLSKLAPTRLHRRLLGSSAVAWADPNAGMDHGKAISVDTSDTVDGQNVEDEVAAAEDATYADPSEPSWSQPSLALGTHIGDASAINEESVSEQSIAAAAAPNGSGP